MEFFYFKTKFLGFQLMDIDNQRTLISKKDENSSMNQHFIVICNCT